ncbi:MAG: hypothetical protein CVV11_06235 [Gammaproteobacteria bacterium HGW-Gammaproteobacteria-15]|nr:MAG: hypothetical protein CVV11_06235 [Gammaproteobacteria bacterium HGW-Gammaproteobacteria-15]
MQKFKFSMGMIFLALAMALVGLLLGIFQDPKWLGNFGALVVMFGVASEYSLLQHELKALYAALKGEGAPVFGSSGIPDLKPCRFHSVLALTSHIVIVLGTVIWGFGEWSLEWLLETV